jgi:hypothetical protein
VENVCNETADKVKYPSAYLKMAVFSAGRELTMTEIPSNIFVLYALRVKVHH